MLKKMCYVLVNQGLVDEEDIEIYEYGLFVILFNALCLISIFVQGIFFNQLSFTLTFLLFYLPNRMILGGYHCKTPQKCFITFNLLYFIMMLLNRVIGYSHFLYLWGIALYIMMLIVYFRKEKKSKYKPFLIFTFTLFLIITWLNPCMRLPMYYAVLIDSILFYI